jgi:triacylglycerol lipase
VFPSLAPARRRLVLTLLALVVIAIVVGSLLAATSGGGHSSHRAAPPDRPGPVLLVPGYGGSLTSLNVLADRLRQAGKSAEVVPMPDNAQGDLHGEAQALAAAARAELKTTGAASVDVVGYSAGGVVARLWIRSYGGAALARRVITLDSPHHGTELAALGALLPGDSVCPTACRQLTPSSDLISALNSGDETPAGPTFVSIWSTNDKVVVPPDSARLDGALNVTIQSVCSTAELSHTDVPASPIVDGMVLAELAAGPPVALTAADCARFSS